MAKSTTNNRWSNEVTRHSNALDLEEGVEDSMAEDRHVYGEVNNKTGMKRVFADIRRDVDAARTRPDLTELYRRAGYMITLTYAPSWEEKFGRDAAALRRVGEDEFEKTAHKINRRAATIGTEADYDEKWGKRK